jgi:hypothetical protein
MILVWIIGFLAVATTGAIDQNFRRTPCEESGMHEVFQQDPSEHFRNVCPRCRRVQSCKMPGRKKTTRIICLDCWADEEYRWYSQP